MFHTVVIFVTEPISRTVLAFDVGMSEFLADPIRQFLFVKGLDVFKPCHINKKVTLKIRWSH